MNHQNTQIHDGLHPDVKEVLSNDKLTKKEKDTQLSKMIFNFIGSANKAASPEFKSEIPKELSDIMERIYSGESEGLFDYDIDPVTKRINAYFGGFGEEINKLDPKVNELLMLKIAGGDYNSVRKTNYYKGVKSEFTELIKYAEENGLKVNINTHSFGSTIARLLADENPSKAINEMNMLNAHMSPFQVLKKLPDHIKLKYHTNINDVLNLKQLLPFHEGKHTYYSGRKSNYKTVNTLEDFAENVNEFIKDHRQEGFTDVERSSSNLMKGYTRAGRIAGIVGLGLTLADVGSRIHKDSKAKTSASTKAMDISSDVGAVGGGFLAGGAVAGAILAPEVTLPALLASFVIGGGVGAGVDHAVTSLFHSKNGKDSTVTKVVKRLGSNEVRSNIKKSVNEKNRHWEHRMNSVAHFFKKLF